MTLQASINIDVLFQVFALVQKFATSIRMQVETRNLQRLYKKLKASNAKTLNEISSKPELCSLCKHKPENSNFREESWSV